MAGPRGFEQVVAVGQRNRQQAQRKRHLDFPGEDVVAPHGSVGGHPRQQEIGRFFQQEPQEVGSQGAGGELHAAQRPDIEQQQDEGEGRQRRFGQKTEQEAQAGSGEEAIANLEEAVDLLKSVVRELRALTEEK